MNALYVAAEFAAVGVRHSQIQERAEDGDRRAKSLLPILADGFALDRYIAASQIGITLSSLGLGAFGQATLGLRFADTLQQLAGLEPVAAHSVAAATVLIGLTTLQMVLGELVPKSLALQFPTRIALATVRPMRWSLAALSWFIRVLNGSGTALLRLLGAEHTGHRHIHSPEEIELLVADSHEGGHLTPADQRRLSRALRLGVRAAREVMTPRVDLHAIEVDEPAEEVVRRVSESPHTRVVVYEESIDQVIGIVHTRDVAAHAAAGGALPPLGELVRPIAYVPESLTTDQVLARLRAERRQIAVVLDEFGGTAGIVTVGDILEEVLGEIADEFKPPEPVPEWLPDGRLRLPGELRVDEAPPWLGASFGGDALTVAGRVLEELGRIPEEGERVTCGDLLVEIERVEHRAIESVLVTRLPSAVRS